MFTWLFRLVMGAVVISAALWLLRSAMKLWVDGPDVEPSTAPWPKMTQTAQMAQIVGAHTPVGVSLAPEAHKAAPDDGWVRPDVAGDTLTSHPVKAKESSRLYHLPGMLAYERTRPDRCYSTPEAAEADGFVRAKR
jgi:hypothetical protein